MYKLSKTFRFESAHRLPNHQGKCQRLHGHDWKLRVILESPSLIESGSSTGMVMDFYDMKQAVQPMLEELDHHFINEVGGLENPTSEVLARWIFDRLAPTIPTLAAIIVDETDGASCEYRP